MRLGRRALLVQGVRLGAGGLALGLFGCGEQESPPSQPKRVYIIGVAGGAAPLSGPALEAFLAGMTELGYREGEDFRLERRSTLGGQEAMVAAIADIAALPPDVMLVGIAGAAARAWLAHADPVPVVHPFINSEEIGGRWIESMARPGRNVTGLVSEVVELYPKRLELLRELLPHAVRIAYLWPGFGDEPRAWPEITRASQGLGMEVRLFTARFGEDLNGAFRQVGLWGADAAVLHGWPPYAQPTARVAGFAARERLPTIYPEAAYVAEGGLLALGANPSELYRRAAVYVDKILKGAKPGDLPVEQPNKFDLAVNLRTARDLGITVPQAVLAQATEVIR